MISSDSEEESEDTPPIRIEQAAAGENLLEDFDENVSAGSSRSVKQTHLVKLQYNKTIANDVERITATKPADSIFDTPSSCSSLGTLVFFTNLN